MSRETAGDFLDSRVISCNTRLNGIQYRASLESQLEDFKDLDDVDVC